MLIAPINAVAAASNGLVLWYKTILPTLLPFAILSNIFITSNIFYMISFFLHPIIRFLLPVTKEGTFPVAAGFLFGFPMGSRICSAMLQEGKLSRQEASIVFIISNNMSPMFIISYILDQSLHLPQLVLPTLAILYLPPLILGRILLSTSKVSVEQWHKNTTPRFQLNFKIIDAAIMNGFEALVKLGGYIMLFSIIASMINLLPISSQVLRSACIGAIEITNGIQSVSQINLNTNTKYLLCIAFTAFGGFSGIAQTSSMVAESHLPMKDYLLAKLFLCACSSILAILVYEVVI
jgi:sporulation integral membrane protein YlbJ